jgi:hypothetical protein
MTKGSGGSDAGFCPAALILELMLFRYAPHRAIIALRGKCSRLFQKILGLNM